MIAIIPARGGSKGLPGKNIRELQGKPLIAYTIEAALKSKEITKVIVSTDSEEIAEIAKKYGAEIPFMRPDFLATDTATSFDVYKYTINRIEKESGDIIKEFIILQPTSPLRNFKHIDESIELYNNKKADSVISYCKENHSIFWHKYVNEDNKFKEVFKGNYQKNRQEIETTYYPNGAIYVFKRDILDKGNYYTHNSYAYIMERNVSLDIDTIDDFDYAEFIIKNNLKKNKKE